MDLVCPKCHAAMRTYERNGVHVDQCTDCRGIFLDKGELERLTAAENAWHGGVGGDRAASAAPSEPTTRASTPAGPGHGTGGTAGGLGAVVGEVLQHAKAYDQQRRQSQQGHPQQGLPQQGGYGQPRRTTSLLDELFG